MGSVAKEDNAERSARGPTSQPTSSGASSSMRVAKAVVPAMQSASVAMQPVAVQSGAVASRPQEPPLVELESLLTSGEHVMTIVTAPTDDVRGSVVAHAVRLLALQGASMATLMSGGAMGPASNAAGPRVVRARRIDDGEVIDALTTALDVQLDTTRSIEVAERIAERVRATGASIVLRVDEVATQPSGWVASVLRELTTALGTGETIRAPSLGRFVVVGPTGCAVLASIGAPSVTLRSHLEPREAWAWIDVAARSAWRFRVGVDPSIGDLEGAIGAALLGESALGEPLPTLRSAAATVPTGATEPRPSAARPTPWRLLVEAERALGLGDHAGADEAIRQAEGCADDPEARRDLGRRWTDLLEPLSPLHRLGHVASAADRAINGADADEAERWAKAAVRASEEAKVDGTTASRHLEVLGRALIAKGDVVMARSVLARAAERATAGGAAIDRLASIAVESAEAAYLAGDVASSEALAHHAEQLVGASDESCLRARNILGKLLLARGLFESADAHFAADILEASRVGDARAELRATLNRAIALLWADHLDEAKSMFERVLEGGRRLTEPRAQALAHENLAVIASLRRDYGAALAHFRAAIVGLKKTGEAAMLAGAAHNLASLYLRFGDVAQAAQVVRFAASLFRRGLSAPVVAEGDDLRARIAAHMGRNEEALAAISHAREILRAAGHTTRVAHCERYEARLALDDGDVRGARLALDRAKISDDSPRAHAEHALLEAEWLRANGDDSARVLLAAREALALCRASTDEDLVITAHLLIAEIARVIGDRDLLQRHLEATVGVRDAMLRSIPEGFHASFLSRQDMVRLAKLERAFESEPLMMGTGARAPQIESVRSRAGVSDAPRTMVGSDPSLRALLAAVRRVGPSDATVLIQGESGTGKELVAEALHAASDRATGPMVKVNCAALVETLLLSELFGHEKGAFTGAAARRRGRFELADGGTLFLDEIGDISPRTQVALLRVLQERTFERVGGTVPLRVDVRVVCATHRDLATMVTRGEFREDLYYRLRGVQLQVPPLRARLGDLPEIASHILTRIADEHGQPRKVLTSDALELLATHRWPGNVRELENVLRAVALLADDRDIRARDLAAHVDVFRPLEQVRQAALVEEHPDAFDGADDEPTSIGSMAAMPALPSVEATATSVAYSQIRGGAVSLFEMKRMIERDCIARALGETRGNITRAAALLGMKRPRLSQLVKHYGLSALFTEGS